MILFIVICFILYLIAMVIVVLGMRQLPTFYYKEEETQTKFSIVIPFRNEAKRLPALLFSIKGLRYSSHLYELIFVDDASEDDSVAIIDAAFKEASSHSEISFKIIPNRRFSASPKKDAITEAISNSKNDWIITTDADCVLPSTWLAAFDAFIRAKDPLMVGGPVQNTANSSFVQQFQKLDGLSLQAVTKAGFGLKNPLLCNGANLAYKKDAFFEVLGFSENNHIASGDDIFLLEKFRKKYPKKTLFLKSKAAIVTTFPESNWFSMIEQRVRWASKTSKQKNNASKALGLLVFLTNLMLIVGIPYCVLNPNYASLFLSILFLKAFIDFIVLKRSSNFFDSKMNYIAFLGSLIIYPFVIVWVVLASLKGRYHWKGRKFEKQG